MDIRQQHQSTLDIDYIRDESLTIKVSDLDLKNNKNYYTSIRQSAHLKSKMYLEFTNPLANQDQDLNLNEY